MKIEITGEEVKQMDMKQDGKAYAEMDWIGRMVNPAPLEYTLHSIGDRRLESALNGVIKVLKENNLSLEQADAVLAVVKGCLHRQTAV